jgi:hypothetical protein
MLELYRDLVESTFASDEERRITAEVAALKQEGRAVGRRGAGAPPSEASE